MTQKPRMNLQDPKEMSRMRAALSLKNHCSFDVKSSEYLNENISLASKATSMPLTDVSISPTKNEEPKTILLFGTRILVSPQDSSSLESKETSVPPTDVTISPTKKRSLDEALDGFCLGSNPKEISLLSDSPLKTDENLKSHYSESSENPKEELKEEARKIKKRRSLANKGRKTEVSTKLDLNTPSSAIRKKLTASDIGQLSRLMLERSHAERHILSHLPGDDQIKIQQGEGFKVKVCDRDKNTEHGLVLKRMVKTTRSYVLNGAWVKDFVRRRDLKEGDEIELFWNSVDSVLYFRVLSRAPIDI